MGSLLGQLNPLKLKISAPKHIKKIDHFELPKLAAPRNKIVADSLWYCPS